MKRFLTRSILLLSFVSLFTDIASEMLYPVLPVFLKSIGFSVLLIGVLEGLAEATAGLSKGYFGNLSDLVGKRVTFVRWGYLLSAISKPMMAAFIWPFWIFFARTLDRLGKGIRTSARDALLSDESSTENKGKVFGFHRGMDTLGAAIGPFLALLFLFCYPGEYKWLFVFAFVPGIVAVSLTWFLAEKAKEVKNRSAGNTIKPGLLAYMKYWKKSSKAYKLLVIGLLAFALFNSSDTFLLLMVKEQGYSDSTMIGLYIFYNLCYALLAYPSGWLADRFGMKRVLVVGFLAFGVVYLLFGFASSLSHFILLFGFYAFYASATEGISKAWISNLVSKEHTATAIGYYNSFQSIAALISSSLAGAIWFGLGPIFMFVVAGFGVVVVSTYIAVFCREKPEEISE